MGSLLLEILKGDAEESEVVTDECTVGNGEDLC